MFFITIFLSNEVGSAANPIVAAFASVGTVTQAIRFVPGCPGNVWPLGVVIGWLWPTDICPYKLLTQYD